MSIRALCRLIILASLILPLSAPRAAAQEAGPPATTFIDASELGMSRPATALQSVAPIAIASSGPASPYPARLTVSGYTNRIGRLHVRLDGLTHTSPEDLDVLLVAPSGRRVMLMSDIGGATNIVDTTIIFQTNSPPSGANPIVNGSRGTGDLEPGDALPSPAPSGPYSTSLDDFIGENANGEWRLYVVDDTGNTSQGSLDGFTLIITPLMDNNTSAAIPDLSFVESQILVSGISGPVDEVSVSLHIPHSATGDLKVTLRAPDGTTVDLANNHGGAGNNYGTGCSLDARTNFDDQAPTELSAAAAPFVGDYRPDGFLGVFHYRQGDQINGVWTLRITDSAAMDTGTLNCWSLNIAYNDFISTMQAPAGLRVAAMEANQVTLRWNPAYQGAPATLWQIEGGVNPGETLATITTTDKWPAYTFPAPAGSFYVRVRGVNGAQLGPASNEIPLLVNVPVPPSAPAILQGASSGSFVSLAWRNTFVGGPPTSMLLEVNGSAAASISLPVTDVLDFSGVPVGDYTLQLRAVNAGGVSPPSAPLSFSIPTIGCTTAPGTPIRLLPFTIGNTLYVTWEPAMDLGAPTSYILNVSGSFTGSFALRTRMASGAVGPGTYTFQVAAVNLCGTSGFASRSITIP